MKRNNIIIDDDVDGAGKAATLRLFLLLLILPYNKMDQSLF